MTAREEILNRIRDSLSESGAPGNRHSAVKRRISSHPSGTYPKPATKRSMNSRFIEKACLAAASVKTVKSYREVGKAIETFLREHNLPSAMRKGSDPRLSKLGWVKGAGPEISIGVSKGNDLVGLSHAEGAVAETGTLILFSGKENPTTLNFLPENHIVILNKKDLVENYETIWTKLRRRYGMGNMPRSVNMICGPSRSADIEQTLILGAHGPIRLHIIIVDDGKR